MVLVQVHSANAELFNSKKASKTRNDNFGVSQNYAKNHKELTGESNSFNKNKSIITESVFSKDTSNQALQQIAKYGEQSVHTHLQQLGSQVQESVKRAFTEQYNRLFGKSIL